MTTGSYFLSHQGIFVDTASWLESPQSRVGILLALVVVFGALLPTLIYLTGWLPSYHTSCTLSGASTALKVLSSYFSVTLLRRHKFGVIQWGSTQRNQPSTMLTHTSAPGSPRSRLTISLLRSRVQRGSFSCLRVSTHPPTTRRSAIASRTV